MHIIAKQSVLDRIIGFANKYVAKDIGAPAHLQTILLDVDADSGTVRVTAENAESAIEFVVSQDIDIQESGKILVSSVRLTGALSVIQPDEKVSFRSLAPVRDPKAPAGNAELIGGRTKVHLPIVTIGEDTKGLLPKVQLAEKKGVKIESDVFDRTFNTGVVAYDSRGTRPQLKSVHIATVGDRLRFLSFNGVATAFAAEPILENALSEDFVTLVDPDQVWPAMDFIKRGTAVILSDGKAKDGAPNKNQLHFTVVQEEKGKGKNKGDDNTKTLFHIRVNTTSGGHAKFPADQVIETVKQYFHTSSSYFSVNHADLLRLFRSADRISSLNHAGRSKDVSVALTKNDLRVSVSGETDFEDFAELREWDGSKEEFIFRWGLYGNALETYPGDSDLRVGIIRDPNTAKIVALALIDDDNVKFNGKDFPENYIAIIPTSVS